MMTATDTHRPQVRRAQRGRATGAGHVRHERAIRIIETAREIVLGLPKAGADFIELGMPFSDPMADGPGDPGGGACER